MPLFSCVPSSCRFWQSLPVRVPWLDFGLWLMFVFWRCPCISLFLRALELALGAVSARMSPVAWLRPVALFHVLAAPLFVLHLLTPLSLAIGAAHASLFLRALGLLFGAVPACMSPVAWLRPAAHFHVLALPLFAFRLHSLTPLDSWAVSSLAASGFSVVSAAVTMFSAPGRC